MECAVCYGETGPFQKLCCGHTFCSGCVKNWYLKGAAGTSCPMCRRPMYFRGFHKVREEWDEEAWEQRCSEIMGEAIDEAFEESREMASYFPPEFSQQIMDGIMEDLQDIDKTMRYLKSEGIGADDIEYVLFETADYYSDRNINKWSWCDEPVKDFQTRYPRLSLDHTGSPKRVRAREDPWMTVSFYIDV